MARSELRAGVQGVLLATGAMLFGWCALTACGGSETAPKTATVSPGGSKDPSLWPKDDRTMCDWRNKPELEVSETAGPGALKPNVRRVYKTFGEGDTRRTVLICREVDTNLDGIKDTVRTFNDKGEALHEEADTDYDGRVDIWMSFVAGRLAEEDVDTNHDGKPDEWKYYADGKLTRAKRDRNFDGNADIWEIYNNGKLERMGVDETFDGHVDRWDRDEQIKAQEDADAKQAAAQLAATQQATVAPGEDAFVPDAGAATKAAATKSTTKKK
jgi:hypothetical protein